MMSVLSPDVLDDAIRCVEYVYENNLELPLNGGIQNLDIVIKELKEYSEWYSKLTYDDIRTLIHLINQVEMRVKF